MRPSPLTDEQLSIRVTHGDISAVTELYHRWKQGLFRFAVRLISDPDAAEDIIHDAFTALIERHSTVRNPSALRSWMYSIVRNEAFVLLDKQKRNRPIDENDEYIFDEEIPDRKFEGAELKEQIASALAQMLPQYKEVLLLREYESMPYEEIAAITGTTVGSVKSRLFKARKALMKRLIPLRKAIDL